jgi:magnesium transporter
MLTKTPRSAGTLADAVWLDLLDPSDEERAQVEQESQLRLPTKATIDEIESSSRVYVKDDALYLSTPIVSGTDCLSNAPTTLGFVLSRKRLVTLRFAPISAIDKLLETYGSAKEEASAADAFMKILETVVDQVADTLEHASGALEHISNASFRREHLNGAGFADASRALHESLRKLGRLNDGISHLRDTLLGLDRVTAFVLDVQGKTRLRDAEPRLHAITSDIRSLSDYESHLTNKIQFLLDATLGFINIQQNDIVKTLTVASVVGVPPVLIAGVYGMNFRAMPELDWPFGYPFALLLIVLSAILPLAWFKWRRWI